MLSCTEGLLQFKFLFLSPCPFLFVHLLVCLICFFSGDFFLRQNVVFLRFPSAATLTVSEPFGERCLGSE